MANHGEKLVQKLLERLQQNVIVRKALAVMLVAGMAGLAGYFIYDLLPRHYAMTITGGEIVGNRHFLAKVLQEEAARAGITLSIRPSHGSVGALEAVNDGHLDLALIQGGLEAHYPNIQHAATLAPELLHFLVRPDIQSVKDIKGRTVNLGSRNGGTRLVAHQVLGMAGLEEGIDYVETNTGVDELITMRSEKLPDVVVSISFAPSFLADFMIKEKGYKVLEIPFPSSLAMRLGWVADGRILGYMYSVNPPVPATDIKTIGVNLHLVANQGVDQKGLARLLEVLYGPAVESRFRRHFDEKSITIPSGYPISAGTLAFLKRNESALSAKTLDGIKSAFGLLMTGLSVLIVLLRWFKGQQSTEDKKVKGFIKEVSQIEQEIRALDQDGRADVATLRALEVRLSSVKEKAILAYTTGTINDSSIVDKFLHSLSDTRGYLRVVAARLGGAEAVAAVEAV